MKKEMKINGTSLAGYKAFAHDGCHKIYILKSSKDIREFKKLDYKIYKLDAGIIQCYLDSCSLRFINLYDGTKQDNEKYTQLVRQFAKKVVFEDFKTDSIDTGCTDYYNMKAGVDGQGRYVVEKLEEETEA